MTPRKGWRPMRRRLGDPGADIETELRLHIEGRMKEFLAAGMTEAGAREKARRQFGDPARIAERCREEKGYPKQHRSRKGPGLMSAIVQDVRYAIRMLIKRPGYTAAVLTTLVLAIGATTAVFSVVNGVLLHPLPHPNPEQLVMVWEVDQRPGFFDDHNRVTAANFADWRDQNRVFESIAAFQAFPITFRGDGDPEQVLTGRVSADFFKTLGVNAAFGRIFLPDDDLPGQSAVVVLSHEFWRTRFAGDSTIVGKDVRIGSGTASVVGVLPAGFDFQDREFGMWIPVRFTEAAYQNRFSHIAHIVARMKPGVTIDMAQRDMDRVVDGLREAYPQFLSGWGVNVTTLTDEVVGDIRPALLVLLGAVAFVLLIGSVNVANLMLARTAGEHREVAVRTALGAGRKRIMQQKLTESLVLSTTGGVLGVVVAAAATKLLLAAAPATLPHAEYVGLDIRVLTFALAISLVTGILFGLAPAVHSTRGDVAGYLREGGRSSTGTRGHQQLRAGFLITQLGFSLVLLISAGLMMSTFARLTSVDPGFDPGGVLTMKISIPTGDYPTNTDQSALYDRLLSSAQSLPGITHAGVTSFIPLKDDEWTWSVQIQGQPLRREGEKRDYGYHLISDDYFRTMGIALQRGRTFNTFDRSDAPGVMIVNEAFVQRFFPDGEDPIGQRMSILGREDVWLEIVGVVEDVNHYSLDTEPLPAYFGPHAQVPWNWFATQMNVVVRASGDPVLAVSGIRQAIRDVDPTIVVSDVRPMRERLSQSVARSRFAMILLGVFAGVALALAAVGIYGVVSYSVGQRAQEIWVRIALGANAQSIVAQFLTSAMKLVAVGVGVGLVGAVALTRFQASLLYGVEAVDPRTYAVVTVVLCGVALVATYIPARRASRIDPMRVLREE